MYPTLSKTHPDMYVIIFVFHILSFWAQHRWSHPPFILNSLQKSRHGTWGMGLIMKGKCEQFVTSPYCSWWNHDEITKKTKNISVWPKKRRALIMDLFPLKVPICSNYLAIFTCHACHVSFAAVKTIGTYQYHWITYMFIDIPRGITPN